MHRIPNIQQPSELMSWIFIERSTNIHDQQSKIGNDLWKSKSKIWFLTCQVENIHSLLKYYSKAPDFLYIIHTSLLIKLCWQQIALPNFCIRFQGGSIHSGLQRKVFPLESVLILGRQSSWLESAWGSSEASAGPVEHIIEANYPWAKRTQIPVLPCKINH